MAIVLDESTRAEYLALSSASSRASLVASAPGSTVYVEVYDGANVLRASGTMAVPWASVSGSTVTVGEVDTNGISVSSGGSPTSDWYCQFRGSNGRFVRGSFGVSTDTADFKWSLATFQTGSRGSLGTVTMSTTGVPEVIVVPSITGTAQVGQVISGDNGTWSGSPTSYEYQHQRSTDQSTWGDISGATSSSYSVVTADLDKYLRRGVRAVSVLGTSSYAYSASSGKVVAAGATPLLSASDITYDGYFHTSLGVGDPKYGTQMLVRRVSGSPRAVLAIYPGGGTNTRWVEIDLSGAINSTISTYADYWDVPNDDSVIYRPEWGAGWTYGTQENITWDSTNSKVIRTTYDGYPNASNPAQVEVVTLNGNHTLTRNKRLTLGSKTDGQFVGGPSMVPAAFQSTYGVGAIAMGTGGYRSLVGQYGGGCLGFASYTAPDLTSYSDGATVPDASLKTLANRTLATAQTSYRAWRGYTFTQTGTVSYPPNSTFGYTGTPLASGTFTGNGPIDYNGKDVRANGSNGPVPTFLPYATEHTDWGEIPAGGGKAYQLWADIYCGKAFLYGSGFTKRGVIAPLFVGVGRVWYANSQVAWERRALELHIFDPEHMGEVALGTRSQHDVHPVAFKTMDAEFPPWTWFSVADAALPTSAWDEVGKKLYIGAYSEAWPVGPSTGWRILRYSVNA